MLVMWMQITDVQNFLSNRVEKKIKGQCQFLESITVLQEIKEILAGIRGTKNGAADRLRKDGALEPLSHRSSTTFQGPAGIPGM